MSLIAVVALLIALLLPVTRGSREAARRSQCVNNLKQIGLALHNYEVSYGMLPPARTVDASGQPLHSWRTLILPYLEQVRLYNSIDLTRPWNDPANARAYNATVGAFHCPSDLGPPNTTTYLASVGPRACFPPDGCRRLAEITNDHGEPLMVIEAGADAAVPWMAPTDADEGLVLGISPTTRVDHPGGTNAVFVDGSVRFIKVSTPAAERREMIEIAGRERQTLAAEEAPSRPGQDRSNPEAP